jgi:IclR family acetate operon transcriptional repressor
VFLQSTSLEAEARPIMRHLADETGQTANLGILDHDQVVHIEVVAPDRPVRFWASIGKREDAYLSGLGKVLLTTLAPKNLDAYLAVTRPAVTANTITGGESLRAELERVAAQGFAVDNEESNLGVVCIAAPIRDGNGRIAAAVSISGSRAEFTVDGVMEQYTAQVQSAAAKISARLGWANNG